MRSLQIGAQFHAITVADIVPVIADLKVRTTPYPQTDGLVEHFSGTLKAMLRKLP